MKRVKYLGINLPKEIKEYSFYETIEKYMKLYEKYRI